MLKCGFCLTGGSMKSFGVARARYDFSARDRSELSLREGDTIKILKKCQNGWWKGEVYGRVRVYKHPHILKQTNKKQVFRCFLTCTGPVFLGGVISSKLCGGGLLWLLLTWLYKRCVDPNCVQGPMVSTNCINPYARVCLCACERDAVACDLMSV